MNTYICRRCQTEKPETEFSWRIKSKGIRQFSCKSCMAEYGRWYRTQRRELLGEDGVKALNKRIYKETREEQLRYHREYYQANKERLNEQSRLYHQQRANTPEYKKAVRDRMLRSNFGITITEFERMYEAQNGVCAICGKPGKMSVDHCHTTGAIRGLLCAPCNSFLGRISDSVETLDKIKDYLQKHR